MDEGDVDVETVLAPAEGIEQSTLYKPALMLLLIVLLALFGSCLIGSLECEEFCWLLYWLKAKCLSSIDEATVEAAPDDADEEEDDDDDDDATVA